MFMGIPGRGFLRKLIFGNPEKNKKNKLDEMLALAPMHDDHAGFLDRSPEIIQAHNKSLEKELAEARRQLDKYAALTQQKDGEHQIKMEVYNFNKQMAAKDKLNTVGLMLGKYDQDMKMWRPLSPSEYPVMFLKNNQPYKRFAGLFLQEYNGEPVMFAWLWDAQKQKHIKLKVPIRNFMDVFRDQLGIAAQMRGGKIDTNLVIDEDGVPRLRAPGIKTDIATGDQIKVIDLSDKERNKYESVIEKQQDYMGKLQKGVTDMQKREHQYKTLLLEYGSTADVMTDHAATMGSDYKVAIEQIKGLGKEVSQILGSANAQMIETVVTESSNKALMASVEILTHTIKTLSGTTPDDAMREKLLQEMKRLTEMGETLKSGKGGVVSPEAIKKIAETVREAVSKPAS